MKSITKQEAQEFKDRWKFVNDFIAHQFRNTPAEIKLQQLSVMFIIGQSRSPVFLAEEQEGRNRWCLLKQNQMSEPQLPQNLLRVLAFLPHP
jgi:hypothetical protein